MGEVVGTGVCDTARACASGSRCRCRRGSRLDVVRAFASSCFCAYHACAQKQAGGWGGWQSHVAQAVVQMDRRERYNLPPRHLHVSIPPLRPPPGTDERAHPMEHDGTVHDVNPWDGGTFFGMDLRRRDRKAKARRFGSSFWFWYFGILVFW